MRGLNHKPEQGRAANIALAGEDDISELLLSAQIVKERLTEVGLHHGRKQTILCCQFIGRRFALIDHQRATVVICLVLQKRLILQCTAGRQLHGPNVGQFVESQRLDVERSSCLLVYAFSDSLTDISIEEE